MRTGFSLRLLLQRRLDLCNCTDARGFRWFDPPPDMAAYLKWVRGRPAQFEPGDRHGHANTNYLFIGARLDGMMGYSHHRYIEQALLTPLGLTHSFARLAEADAATLVSG